MAFPNGKFNISSGARPGQYVTSIDNQIVGYSGRSIPPGAINEWLVKLHDGPLFTFEAIVDGEGSGQYIYYENGSLTLGKNPSFFTVRESPRAPTLSFIGTLIADGVWALLSWDNNTPVILETKTESTEELWNFQEI